MKELWKNFERTMKSLERILKKSWISLELTLKEQKCDRVSEWQSQWATELVCDLTGSREARASKN